MFGIHIIEEILREYVNFLPLSLVHCIYFFHLLFILFAPSVCAHEHTHTQTKLLKTLPHFMSSSYTHTHWHRSSVIQYIDGVSAGVCFCQYLHIPIHQRVCVVALCVCDAIVHQIQLAPLSCHSKPGSVHWIVITLRKCVCVCVGCQQDIPHCHLRGLIDVYGGNSVV